MIAVLGNVNMEPFKSAWPHAYFGSFGQHLRDLLDENSPLYRRPLEAVLIFLDAENLLKDDWYCLPSPRVLENARRALDAVCSAAARFSARRPKALVVMNDLVFPPDRFTTDLETNGAVGFNRLETCLNQRLYDWARRHAGVAILNWGRLVAVCGYGELTSEKFYYLGRIRLSQKGFDVLRAEFEALLRACRTAPKKVLVMDLDNTLWGGVCGEDGIEGISLSEEGLGKAYRDFQKEIKALRRVGILLALNSKNNPEDAMAVLGKHDMMVLKPKDFVAKKINWENKVKNLRQIARELNLGLDAFVYLDDSPAERAFVKGRLPEVEVPEFPRDPSDLRSWFLKSVVYPYFRKTALTPEDRRKNRQYRSLLQRNRLARRFDEKIFLRSLQMRLKVHVNAFSFRSRLAQLAQKTNQFNLTTRRYTEGEIGALMRDRHSAVFGLDYSDRFGREGIVGAAVARWEGREAFLEAFLLSCRVMGRGVEFHFLKDILQALKKKGVKKIRAEYIPTAKNKVCKDFYKASGFRRIAKGLYEKNVS